MKYQLKWAGFLTPVEPIGCQLLPNDVMVFHLQGNTGFRLTGVTFLRMKISNDFKLLYAFALFFFCQAIFLNRTEYLELFI